MGPIPQYFLVRPDTKQQTSSGVVVRPGAIVPLIAVDQLPEWIDIAGVPRNLEPKDASGMINLGRGVKSDGIHDIRLHMDTVFKMITGSENGNPASGSAKGNNAGVSNTADILDTRNAPISVQRNPDTRAQTPAAIITQTPKSDVATKPARPPIFNILPRTSPQPREHPAELMLQASRHAVPEPGSPPATHQDQLPPHISPSLREKTKMGKPQRPAQERGKDPDYLTTAYCRHWCHHGTCKWGLNCRYEHTMPTTLEGLQEVGLKGFPSWFITAMGFTLSSMGMAPMGIGMGPMGMNPLATRMGLFGHIGGNGAKKMKKARDPVTMVSSQAPAAHASAISGMNAQSMAQEKIKEREGLQAGGSKSDLENAGSYESNGFGKATMQGHGLEVLQPLPGVVAPGQATGGPVGDEGKGVPNHEEKLLDI